MTSIDVLVGADRMQGIVDEHLDEYDLTPVFAGAGIGSFVVDSSHPAVEFLDLDAAWVSVEHRGRRLFTAFIEEDEVAFGDAEDTARPYTLRDHWCILDENLAWVAPENDIAPRQSLAGRTDLAQSVATGATTAGTVANQSGYFAWQGATAEDAVRNIVTRGLTRAGYTFAWASASQGRGLSPFLPDVRMLTLSEAILPVLEAAGLGIDVWREGDTYKLEILEPREYPQILTLDGPLRPGRAKRSRRAITHAVVGGPGEEAARQWWQVSDPVMQARFDRRIEVARDATGAKLVWPETFTDAAKVPKYYLSQSADVVPTALKDQFIAYLNAAGRDALADGRPTSSLTVELAESGTFELGSPNGFSLGDRLRMAEHVDETGQPLGLEYTDRVSSARIQRTTSSDETVTPVVGGAEQDESQRLWAQISKLAARQRRLTTQK